MSSNHHSRPASRHRLRREQLRERFLANPPCLPDSELLELLLGYVLRGENKQLAKILLKRFGSLRAVLEAPAVELRESDGVTPALEAFWAILRECEARLAEIPAATKLMPEDLDKVVHMARRRLGGYRHEEMWAAFLDKQNHLLHWCCLSKGTGGRVFLPQPEIIAKALECNADGIILVHNHPGGNVMPSPQDIDFTTQLVHSGKLLELRVVDHLIITDEEYFSMRARNLLGN